MDTENWLGADKTGGLEILAQKGKIKVGRRGGQDNVVAGLIYWWTSKKLKMTTLTNNYKDKSGVSSLSSLSKAFVNT